jgi:hypothetical protein
MAGEVLPPGVYGRESGRVRFAVWCRPCWSGWLGHRCRGRQPATVPSWPDHGERERVREKRDDRRGRAVSEEERERARVVGPARCRWAGRKRARVRADGLRALLGRAGGEREVSLR